MILILNGPINSGKTTIANILSQKLPKCANIEVDNIRPFVIGEGDDLWQVSFEASVDLAKSFLKKGFNVIFTYHISNKQYQYIVEHLKNIENDILAFTLKPSKEVLLSNKRDRHLNDYLLQKLARTYDNPEYDGTYGEVIDNTNQTPAETSQYIFSKIEELTHFES